MTSRRLPRTVRIVGAMLAAIWLCAGSAVLVVGAMERHWIYVLVAIGALWYGAVWVSVARQGRQLTAREALTPWRLWQRPDA